jgi:hypothetical protein
VFWKFGPIEWVLDVASSSVSPSGAALAAMSEPIEPPAPGRLSTMTGEPRRSLSFWEMARAKASVAPPAGNGTIRRMGLLEGGVCAQVVGVDAAASVRRNVRRLSMFFFLLWSAAGFEVGKIASLP